ATNWQAMSEARLPSSGVRTVPLSTAAMPAITAWMLEPGTNFFRMRSRASGSAPTRISSCRTRWPRVSKKNALVWPSPLAIRNTRLEDCTTASTLSGADTTTSLSSKGNCTRKDLPSPSVSGLEMGKLALAGICQNDSSAGPTLTCVLRPCASAAGSKAQMPTIASSRAPAISLILIRMVCQPSCRHCVCVHPDSVDAIRPCFHSVHQHPDGIAALVGARRLVLGVHVGDAAQRKRDLAHGVGEGQDLGLAGGELQGRGIAFGQLLAVLGLDQLADGQHAHVAEERIGHELRAAPGFAALPARQDDVDVVVGQDEPADAGLLLDAGGNGAHALGQNGGKHTAFPGPHQLDGCHRLAGQHRG